MCHAIYMEKGKCTNASFVVDVVVDVVVELPQALEDDPEKR